MAIHWASYYLVDNINYKLSIRNRSLFIKNILTNILPKQLFHPTASFQSGICVVI